MNIMYTDRNFLLMLEPKKECKRRCTLLDRFILSNNARDNPYNLAEFIDRRTLNKHEKIITDENLSLVHPVKNLWSFYLPTKGCPLGYRELSVWFLLWSFWQGKKNADFTIFPQSLTGLENELGLGARQAKPLVDKLVEHDLIDVEYTAGWPWFLLYDFEDRAHWFEPLESKIMPARFAKMRDEWIAQADKNKIANEQDFVKLDTTTQEASHEPETDNKNEPKLKVDDFSRTEIAEKSIHEDIDDDDFFAKLRAEAASDAAGSDTTGSSGLPSGAK